MSVSQFYFNRESSPNRQAHVRALGLHETMPPCVIRHGGEGYPFLFMHFHDDAYLGCSSSEPQACKHGFILWPPGALHNYGNPSQCWDHSWLIASGDCIMQAALLRRLPLGKLLLFDSEEPFTRYLTALLAELRRKSQQDPYMLEGLLSLMLYELARASDEGNPKIPGNLRAAEDFMRRNFNRQISLREIAENASLSVSRFIFMFKRFYGEAPVHFLIRMRLERSAQLLAYRDIAIKQIAQEVGVGDQLYFSRQFKKAFGKSPKEFRNDL